MFGYNSQSQLISCDFLDLIQDSKRSEFQLFTTGDLSTAFESFMLKKDGSRFAASIYALPNRRNEVDENSFFIFIKESEFESEDQKNLKYRATLSTTLNQ